MNLGNVSDQLPTYPNTIHGELRLILQTKDIFLVCYKHLEEYRKLVNEQNRLITKEFVQEQLQIGEDEISELKMEFQDAESRLSARLRHNEVLAEHLAGLGYASLENGASIRHLALIRSPQQRKNMMAQRQSAIVESRPATHMIDNIALAISEIHTEVRSKVKPLLDYYRDLFYLQLHFSLVLGQVCNYCMPLVTENISLIDRVFFWSERPEFDLVRRAGDISDRLKEIYTRAQTVLSVLGESVRFLQSKVELQKTLEQRFHERLDEQQKTKDKILREVHGTKQTMDTLEEENDRLVGSLVKVDPSFVDSRHFVELAEGGNMSGIKKTPQAKDSGKNNSDHNNGARVEPTSSSGKRNSEVSNTDSIDENNNKAMSVAGDLAKVNELQADVPTTNNELHALLKDLKDKMSENEKTSKRRSSSRTSRLKEHETTDHGSPLSDGAVSRDSTPKRKKRTSSKGHSKIKRSESQQDRPKRTSKKTSQGSKVRRSTSEERNEHKRQKKVRSKSTVGAREKSESPKLKKVDPKDQFQTISSSLASGDDGRSFTPPQQVPVKSIKSKLLGRTRDLLDAALRRPVKPSDNETYLTTNQDSTLETNEPDPIDANNEGVTSVSSFASLMMSETPSSEGEKLLPVRNIRTLEPKLTKKEKKSTSSKRSKRKSIGKGDQLEQYEQLPSLESDSLLIDAPNEARLGRDPTPQSRKSSRAGRKSTSSNLANFLANTSSEEVVTASLASSLPPLL